MIPSRGLLKVKPVETAESLPGSAILLVADARARMTANQCEVIAVGAFAACDDEDCLRPHAVIDATLIHAHNIGVGDWLLVEPRSYLDGPEPERREWFVHQDKVLAILGTGANA